MVFSNKLNRYDNKKDNKTKKKRGLWDMAGRR